MGSTNRRHFLQGATALALGSALRTRAATPAGDRLGVAIVGVGGMGAGHLRWLLDQTDLRVAAVCDVDSRHLGAAGALAPDAVASGDFREVVGRDDVDAVLVATPDHWHALVAVAAARAGKHVYCEKPLANSVVEGRAIGAAVAEAGVLLQTGSHERSNPGAAAAKRVFESGRLGEVRVVRIHLPNSDPHLQEVENFTTPPADSAPPKELDYDFWLGHTPEIPFNERRCHFWWRFHSRFGGGEMTDRGAHVIDLAHMILGLDTTGPTRVEATGRPPAGDFFDTPVTFRFDNLYGGGLRMVGDNSGARGLTLEGTEGKLFIAVHGCGLSAEPASLLEGFEFAAADPYEIHRRAWIDAARAGKGELAAPAEAGHRTATACHLNNLAIRFGRGFDWDPVAERSSDDEVNAALTPPMRAPWTL